MSDSSNTLVFIEGASANATGRRTLVIAIKVESVAHLPSSNLIKLHVYLSYIYLKYECHPF